LRIATSLSWPVAPLVRQTGSFVARGRSHYKTHKARRGHSKRAGHSCTGGGMNPQTSMQAVELRRVFIRGVVHAKHLRSAYSCRFTHSVTTTQAMNYATCRVFRKLLIYKIFLNYATTPL